MCTYIILTFPNNKCLSILTPLLADPIEPTATENPLITSLLQPGEAIFLGTNRWCDCDTPLGRWSNEDETKRQAKIDKLRKKGWGEQKIMRALQSELSSAGSNTEITTWLKFIKEAVKSFHLEFVGLFLHFYRGPLPDEPMVPVRSEWVRVDKLDQEALLRLKEDVLYRFHG